jgi:uncharacterized membrane protein
MRFALAAFQVLLAIAYPVAVWWSLTHFSARMTGLVVLAVLIPALALRLRRAEPGHRAAVLRVPLSVMALLLVGVIADDARLLLAMPVLINGVLLVSFAGSLRGSMPMVERFARIQDPHLDEAQIRHCRQATVAWSVFFLLNGAVSALLALAAPVSWWAAYTGGIAYGLMGAMFALEMVVRVARFGPQAAGSWLVRFWPNGAASRSSAQRRGVDEERL